MGEAPRPDGEPPRLMIWVQHLLGIGHLMRAAAVAREGAAAGWRVVLVSGGPPLPDLDTGGADFVQLPAVKAADPAFSALVDMTGGPVDERFRRQRRDMLLDLFGQFAPDILMTEHYPFGRRQLRFELDPLLESAAARSPRPAIVASLRDILVARRPDREAECADIVNQTYDRVLVHGDPALVRLEASFRPAAAIADRVDYTGYVSGPAVPAVADRAGPVVVSAGGGAVGAALADTATAAARAEPRRRWHLLVGHGVPVQTFEALVARAPGNLTVERARPDFRTLLAGATASVSQAGYNTVVDLLSTGTPAVLVPFAANNETEQSLRAERMAALGRAVLVPEAALDPERLAAAVDRALTLRPTGTTPRLDGAAETIRLLGRLLPARAA